MIVSVLLSVCMQVNSITRGMLDADNVKLSYQVSGLWEGTSLSMRVHTSNEMHTSLVSLPAGMYVLNPVQWKGSHMMRPSVGVFQGREHPTVWVLGSDLVGSYEHIYIFAYEWRGSHWRAIDLELGSTRELMSFSNRGGFMTRADTVIVWDALYDGIECNQCAQRFVISFWEVGAREVSLAKSVLTRKRYQPEGRVAAMTVPFEVRLEDDPLSEVGLRWAWWDVGG